MIEPLTDLASSIDNSKLLVDNESASLFNNHPFYQDFEHKMHDCLKQDNIDKAINVIDEDLNDGPQN